MDTARLTKDSAGRTGAAVVAGGPDGSGRNALASDDNWGEAARFGVFIVGVEPVPEAEWWAMAPAGVSIHAARVTAPAPWATWRPGRDGVDLSPDLERGAKQFAGMALDAVVVAHSSSSVIGGEGWDAAAQASLKALLPPVTAVTTNGDDCVAALRASGVARPFVVFPPWFGEGAIQSGIDYLAARGFAPAAGARHEPEARWRDTPRSELYARGMHLHQRLDLLESQIVDECPRGADGVLLVGTGLRCVGIIAALEERLGRPVVTANQASLWRCLRIAGVDRPVTGYGGLFSLPAES